MNIGSICGKVYLFNTHFLFVCFQDIYPDNITSLDKYLSSSCEKTKLRRKRWQIISLGFCIKKIVLRKLFMKLFPHYLYTPGQHWDQRTRKFHHKYCKNNTLLLYKKKKIVKSRSRVRSNEKTQKKLTLSKIDFLSSVIVIGLG